MISVNCLYIDGWLKFRSKVSANKERLSAEMHSVATTSDECDSGYGAAIR